MVVLFIHDNDDIIAVYNSKKNLIKYIYGIG